MTKEQLSKEQFMKLYLKEMFDNIESGEFDDFVEDLADDIYKKESVFFQGIPEVDFIDDIPMWKQLTKAVLDKLVKRYININYQ